MTILQQKIKFEKLYGKTIDYKFTEPRSGDIKYSYAQIEGLNKLGYNPKYSVQEGLKEYILIARTRKDINSINRPPRHELESNCGRFHLWHWNHCLNPGGRQKGSSMQYGHMLI